jgi:hypothetical protein
MFFPGFSGRTALRKNYHEKVTAVNEPGNHGKPSATGHIADYFFPRAW